MRKAYRDAASRLDWEVDEQGRIHAEGFVFTTIGTKRFTAADGSSFAAQELANGEPLRLLEGRDQAKYVKLTRLLIRLEQEVLRDPTAPVDKDRMAGQNIFSEEANLNYILDHGQAALLDRKVHDRFVEFTRRGFAGDVEWMAGALSEITGIRPKVDQARTCVRETEMGERRL